MENLEITQTGGEPPIYREMKPVPLTLESCILNSEDFTYNQTEQALVIKDNCDDGELSAEEINSMIIINEGPNALSSAQEEYETSKLKTNIRNASDIKKILTSDLPKGERFLSTKSLQRLSGGKKLIRKFSKYTNEGSSDNDDSSVVKIKRIFTKQSKAVKENLDSTNQGHKTKKKDVNNKLKVKSLKRGNSLEKLSSKKMSLKSQKKTGLSTIKDLKSGKKAFKKKVLENSSVIKKKNDFSRNEKPESGTENTIETKKSQSENKPKLLISRSGRIRKVKEASDFILMKNIREKVVNPEGDLEAITTCEPEKNTDTVFERAVPVEANPIIDKENKSRGDLLQSALSESVESWFDVSLGVETKGKKTRGKVKIIPKDSDSCFEETGNSLSEKSIDEILSEIPKIIETLQDDLEEVDKLNAVTEEKTNENVFSTSQNINKTHTVQEENQASDIKDRELTTEKEKNTENDKNSGALNGKKVKPANRQLMGYKKKRRKTRNITVSSYLKNYGEKIDFGVKLDPDKIEVKKEDSDSKNSTEKASLRKESIKNGNGFKLNKDEENESFVLCNMRDKEASKCSKTSPLKKSQSADSLQTSAEVNIESPRKSAEMPASLPSREKELNLNSFVSLKNQTIENFKDRSESWTSNDLTKETNGSTTSEQKPEKVEVINEIKPEDKDKKIKIQNRIRKTGMKYKRKMWTRARREKFECRKALIEFQKKKAEQEPKLTEDSKPLEETIKTEVVETKENFKILNEKSGSLGESFSSSSALSIPLKKRPRRTKTNETLDEIKKENKEGANESDKQDCERRKSHREIKLTPKIVDMIATSFSYKRSRKISVSKDESAGNKEEVGFLSLAQKMTEAKTHAKEDVFEQPLAGVPSVENYLQSKMEANASNFECSWEPGDLVWARFAGNPFWPALILRDPFRNDEYSTVKYFGRLPRPFVHVQFLADFGRRAWGPEMYIMNFTGLEEFEKLKSNLPEVNASTLRKDLMYQQAFFTSLKLEKSWTEAVKEAETLLNKSKDERITYMKIKYPLVKYAASVANGRLVPNERSKVGDSKSPQSRGKKRKSVSSVLNPDETSNDWPNKRTEDTFSKDTFECVNTSGSEETKKNEKESPKITLKLVRSPKKGAKRKSSKLVDEVEEKKTKKRIRKEALEDDYVPSDSGSNGEKGPETTGAKQKKYFLFKGARTEKVCQICLEILENEKTVKCKGACQGLFHKSCAEKMKVESKGPVVKNRRRKKLFADADADNSSDVQLKESAEKEWRCNDCLRGENPCFVCNSTSGNRQRCSVAFCGKFYHQKCLKLYPQTIYNQGAPIKKAHLLQQSKTTECESPHYQILSCPLHVCHTCASDNPADFNMKYLSEKLVKCIKCPSAYHCGNYCVPAGSTILNTSQIICAKHGDPKKMSHVNISWCFICNMGGSLICCEWCPSSFHLDCLNIKPPEGPYICEECESGRFPLYGEVVWVKMGRYRWWPARILFPQEILPNIMALPHKPWEFAVRFYGSNDHYWLNRGRVFLYQEGDAEQTFKGQSNVDKVYQRAVHEATKDYFTIQEERKSKLFGTNNSGAMKPPPYVKIKTNKAVGKVQLGNLLQSEPQTCDCDPNSEAPCSPGSDCLNRMLLVECNPNYCNAGSRCRNQSFEKREYPPLEPYRTERRGWGLRSSVDIPKGSFVIEYVGEVVDDEEFKRRMKRKQETKDSNYYFLEIDKDRMIDAGPKGNLARFMNHSCSPNCETQKWTVNRDTRVGLFALRDIPAGTELTFNYNLDCIGNEKKACHCEEENCSGYIGVKAKIDKAEAFKNKMARRLDKESEDECYVCNDGGELMVCDLPNCPKVYHLECVNLSEWPNEMWFCPRHQCSVCNKATKRCCKLCPTAFCSAHLDSNIFPDYQGGLLCSKHSTVKPAQILRKASYVNRNTPVVEYEKPFAEKYRPPPQKERTSVEEKKEEILMEPNLTDDTPIVVENPLLSSTTPNRLSDGVSVQILYVDEEGQIVSVDESSTSNPGETVTTVCESEELPKPVKKKKRTNIPRKKLNPPVVAEESENKQKAFTQGGINFESLMIKSVEDKILDSKLNLDNIYNIIGGGGGGGGGGEGETCQSESAERCIRDESNDLKPETVNKKEDSEVDRSRRSKYFKIITPEKFIKVTESESKQKKVTDFNYIEFMHPLRSARSKTKTDENTRK